jgi:hypothetical protein
MSDLESHSGGSRRQIALEYTKKSKNSRQVTLDWLRPSGGFLQTLTRARDIVDSAVSLERLAYSDRDRTLGSADCKVDPIVDVGFLPSLNLRLAPAAAVSHLNNPCLH